MEDGPWDEAEAPVAPEVVCARRSRTLARFTLLLSARRRDACSPFALGSTGSVPLRARNQLGLRGGLLVVFGIFGTVGLVGGLWVAMPVESSDDGAGGAIFLASVPLAVSSWLPAWTDGGLRRLCVLAGDVVTAASGMMGSSTAGLGSMPVTYLMNVAIARKQYFPGVVNANRTGSVWAQSRFHV